MVHENVLKAFIYQQIFSHSKSMNYSNVSLRRNQFQLVSVANERENPAREKEMGKGNEGPKDNRKLIGSKYGLA